MISKHQFIAKYLVLPIQVKQLPHAAPTTGACVDPTEVVVVVAESRTSPGA